MAVLICILVFCMVGVVFNEEPWRKEISELKEIVKHQLNIINKLTDERSIPTTVAFHACFSHYAGNLGRAHELGYDYVFVDTHAAYDKFSGTFRVPSEGVYAFTWTTFTYYGDIVLELLVNGVVKGRSHSASTGDVISSTGFVIISAAVNDVVMVRTHPNFDPRGVIRSDGAQMSCFSGWKIN